MSLAGPTERTRARVLDLNCDLGESFGVYRYGADEAVMPLITSANVACGAHGGDPRTMRTSVELAMRHGVAVGAHVGLPDREGFGRRFIAVTPSEVHDLCLAQMGALAAFTRARGVPLAHLKLHGALYMMAMDDADLAEAVCRAVLAFDAGLRVVALPDSALASAARASGLTAVEEFFADRPYRDGAVTMFGWTPDELGPAEAAGDRVGAMLADPEFDSIGTVCVHSDTAGAPALLHAVRERLRRHGCAVSAPAPSHEDSRSVGRTAP
ncbi:lactam utilization protein LamB [Pseudonocardia sp. CNS-004]|nr:lactam utilization protein LamB [Pseudonocardia sp. CNS-004]